MPDQPVPHGAYLDYAATAAVRPPEVVDAVCAFLRDVGATPGRAGHRRAVEAGRIAFRCRRALAELLNIAGDPGRIVFQLNATHALNAALFGLLRRGDRVVRTAYDHNAVRRPVAHLARSGITETVLSGTRAGTVDFAEAEAALRGAGTPARLLVLTHASNVLGTVLPVRELSALAHEHGTLVLLDAAQAAGHLPVDVQQLGVDLVALSGHKGLLGPQGTGALWVRPGIDLAPTVWGGTGSTSHEVMMPALLPDRLEAGTQNAPGLAGLLAGVQWLLDRGVAEQHQREAVLKQRLGHALGAVPEVTVHSPPAPEGVGIVTMTARSVPAAELALRLDREHDVFVRAGLHCAPETHALLGTEHSGAVRFSVGWATTAREVDAAVRAVAAVSGGEPSTATAEADG